MALYFSLMGTTTHGVQRIGSFNAVRIHGTADPDSIGTYNVDIRTTDRRWTGTVTHRYGDGAWSLVAAALAKADMRNEEVR